MTNPRTFIIYKAERASAHGWRERKLLPSGSLTSILSEESSRQHHPTLPKVGDRVQEYENLQNPGKGVTHERDSNWKVSRIEQFTSQDTDDQIVICYCQHDPIDANWEELHRGSPIPEILEAVEV